LRKIKHGLAIAGLVLVVGVGRFAAADIVTTEEALADKVLGNPDAPITIIEYSSLTCPHCASFHKNTLPELRKQYLETGKAKLIYRDFPFDGAALRASMLARCSGDGRFFGFLDVLFKTQETWARAADPMKALEQVGRMGGLSAADVESCMKDEALMDGILRMRMRGEREFRIESTPTFIVNGKSFSGALPFDEFESKLKSLSQ